MIMKRILLLNGMISARVKVAFVLSFLICLVFLFQHLHPVYALMRTSRPLNDIALVNDLSGTVLPTNHLTDATNGATLSDGFNFPHPQDSPSPEPSPTPSPIRIISRKKLKCVEINVGDTNGMEFKGVPLHRLAEVIKEYPEASSFHLRWFIGTPGGCINEAALFTIKTQKLKIWSSESNCEWAWDRDETDYYSRVTRVKVLRLASQDPSQLLLTLDDLEGVGCPCKTVRRK